MLALNLPGFAPKVAEKDGKRTIFDPVRRKYVALTPEEWVRQHFVNYLITIKSYPKELLANEVLVKLNGTSKGCIRSFPDASGHCRIQSALHSHYRFRVRPDCALQHGTACRIPDR